MAKIIQFPPERAARAPRIFTLPGEGVPLDFMQVARLEMSARGKTPVSSAEIVEFKERRNVRKLGCGQGHAPLAS